MRFLVCSKQLAGFLVAALLTVVPFIGFAKEGGSDGGGGVGFKCSDRVFLADSYGNSIVDASDMVTPKKFLNGKIRKSYSYMVLKTLALSGRISGNEAMTLNNVIQNKLTFDPNCSVWITNDDHIPNDRIPLFCEKVQIASQANGHVCYDANLTKYMYSTEQALLQIHEAYIYLGMKANGSTARIRKLVNGLSDRVTFDQSPSFLKQLGDE